MNKKNRYGKSIEEQVLNDIKEINVTELDKVYMLLQLQLENIEKRLKKIETKVNSAKYSQLCFVVGKMEREIQHILETNDYINRYLHRKTNREDL